MWEGVDQGHVQALEVTMVCGAGWAIDGALKVWVPEPTRQASLMAM